MYYNWIAVKGRKKADVFADLDLVDTELAGDFFESPHSYIETAKDWLVMVSPSSHFLTPDRLAKVSAGGEAMGLWLSDTAMGNGLTGYRDGVEIWALDYDCESKPRAVTVKGLAPAEFAEVNAEAEALEAATPEPPDYLFEVIPKTAEAICGFWLDEWEGDMPIGLVDKWHLPKVSAPGGPGFFARLFGRR